MVKVTDILNWTKLLDHVAEKHVTMRLHPEFDDLAIFNYADIVQIQGLWDHETRTARGLIVNTDTLEVLARPFAKFHNLSEHKEGTFDVDAPLYHVGNKFDGSLGIVYRQPNDVLAVATRGSFESEQAKHATELLRSEPIGLSYDPYYNVIDQGYTPLVEIIYPENRIVVDYHGEDDLFYLGMIDNETGAYEAPVQTRYEQTLRTVLALPDRPNAEGYVVWINEFTAVKIKQQDYIELHRIVTGLNRKSVWRALSKGEDEFKALLAQLPDELYAWAEGVAKELREEYATIMRDVDAYYQGVTEAYYFGLTRGAGEGRALFAQAVAGFAPKEYAGFMFALLDQQYGRVQDKIWTMIEPKGSER